MLVRVFAGLLAVALLATGCGRGDQTFRDLARESLAQLDGVIELDGLTAEVEVIRDRWGIPHIYAQNLEDLFFAQGFVIAQDRLWQMEMWRRVSEGRTAELIGPEGVAHDRLVRILKYRGPWDETEYSSYHPDGRRIFESYAAGINAFIEKYRDNLPVEFKLTGIQPEPWTPQALLSRARLGHAISDARRELRLAMAVRELGPEAANRRDGPDPWRPIIVPEGLDLSVITEDAIAALEGDMYPEFPVPELLPKYRDLQGAQVAANEGARETSPGSNGWAVQPRLSATGGTLNVDDPHRQVTLPAHRYIVHLNAPGWNVVGATEPTIPGVIRGHNGYVAWSRTAAETDQADVFVLQLNPDNPEEMLYNGKWEPLQVVTEEIVVKGEAEPRRLKVLLSRHGPVFHVDEARNVAFALRSHLQEPGTAEYAGALRLDQARTAQECIELAAYLIRPQTNLTCADADGNIGWTLAALAPIREGRYGRMPVPGNTDRYEWRGFRTDHPRLFSPPEGYIATANNNTQPPDVEPPFGFRYFGEREPPRYRRYERIRDVLAGGTGFTVEDMRTLLSDSYNTEAAELQPYFRGWSAESPPIERARRLIAEWDGFMKKESTAAAIYWAWRSKVNLRAIPELPQEKAREAIVAGLESAISELESTLGPDWGEWRWGRIHRTELRHPLVSAFDLEPVERDGGGGTVNATGAVYRLITNFADLDRSLGIIAPGQSGQPESPYYDNLTDMWVRGEMFEVAFTREAVEAVAAHRLYLRPSQRR